RGSWTPGSPAGAGRTRGWTPRPMRPRRCRSGPRRRRPCGCRRTGKRRPGRAARAAPGPEPSLKQGPVGRQAPVVREAQRHVLHA
ncbi:unnamed protein product, partial [Prorocentrum cordatum]